VGDSHIQADFLTEVVRRNLQEQFGNAGRGLVVPFRVAGTNEPLNFRTAATGNWISKRCIHLSNPMPIGIGGITLHTQQPEASLLVRMRDPMYDFSRISIFFDPHQSFTVSVTDSLKQELGIHHPNVDESLYPLATFQLPSLHNQVFVNVRQLNADQKQFTMFGIHVDNNKEGVLYHAVGVNGAKYQHYLAAQRFADQTRFLSPDLIIVSLGTNEANDYPYIDKSLNSSIQQMITQLQQANPDAAFILTTPADVLKRKKNNPGVEQVRNEILLYAVENGLGFWDQYKIQGGKYSAATWQAQGLFHTDGIHFTKEGYRYLGKLFFEAMMKGYTQHVSNRY
jgi:lysophospholipase L1-like esterase